MIELLSPAGSMEALRAAVQNGANAVYLGCGTFNARQSAKNFSYVNDYQNSLAYKQIQEENNQSIINAQRTAGVQSYYANLMAQNANAQLDITKSLTTASYLSQENSMSSSYFQTNAGLENQIYNILP